jgi:hypothetical protein
MKKSILIIDTPENCKECPVRSFIGYGKWCAGYNDLFIDSYPNKPSWCPLIEINAETRLVDFTGENI